MKQQYATYKRVMKAEYAKYRATVNAANVAIRKCPGKTVKRTIRTTKRKPNPPKPPSTNRKPVPRKSGGTWSVSYWRRWMSKCKGTGMCKYACGAKYNMLYYKDRYYQAVRYSKRAYAVLARKWRAMKGLKGNAYKKARRAVEPYRQRHIKSKNYVKKLLNVFKSKRSQYYKAVKYCNRRKSAVVRKRGGGSWSWKTRTTWIRKNMRYCGCWKVCAAKWNLFRLRDQYNNQQRYISRLSRQVKAGWGKLKGLNKASAAYKSKRQQLEPLRKKLQNASRHKSRILKSYRKASNYYRKVKAQGCAKKKTTKKTSRSTTRYYRWSWSWYVNSKKACPRYLRAVSNYNRVAKSYTAKSNILNRLYRKNIGLRKLWRKNAKKYNAAYRKAAAANMSYYRKTWKPVKSQLDKAKKELKAAKAWCYGRYLKSSWYRKWRSWRYRKTSRVSRKVTRRYTRGRRYTRRTSRTQRYVRKYWGGSWNRRWISRWTYGGWGWNRYEWAKYKKTCTSEGMCERGCAAKYKVEKITQKHDAQKKVYDSVKS